MGELVEDGEVIGDGGDSDVAGGLRIAGGEAFIAKDGLAAALGEVDGGRPGIGETVQLLDDGQGCTRDLAEVLGPGCIPLEVGKTDGHVPLLQREIDGDDGGGIGAAYFDEGGEVHTVRAGTGEGGAVLGALDRLLA